MSACRDEQTSTGQHDVHAKSTMPFARAAQTLATVLPAGARLAITTSTSMYLSAESIVPGL